MYTLIKTESMVQLKNMLKKNRLKIEDKDLEVMNADNKKILVAIHYKKDDETIYIGVSILFKGYPVTKKEMEASIKKSLPGIESEALVYPQNNKRIQKVLLEISEKMKDTRSIHSYAY